LTVPFRPKWLQFLNKLRSKGLACFRSASNLRQELFQRFERAGKRTGWTGVDGMTKSTEFRGPLLPYSPFRPCCPYSPSRPLPLTPLCGSFLPSSSAKTRDLFLDSWLLDPQDLKESFPSWALGSARPVRAETHPVRFFGQRSTNDLLLLEPTHAARH